MKKSEEKPSCKVRVESGEKTFGVVVGNSGENFGRFPTRPMMIGNAR